MNTGMIILIVVLVIIVILHFLIRHFKIRIESIPLSEGKGFTEAQKKEFKAIEVAYAREMERMYKLEREHHKKIDQLNYWRESVLTDNLTSND